MKTRIAWVVAAVAAVGFAATARPAASHSESSPMSAIAATSEQWASVAGFITKAAEQVPESSYAWKPTPAVRSFGQLIGHLAGTQLQMCGLVLGEKVNAEDSVEKGITSKAALVDAMKASNEKCKKAYAISESNANKNIKMFGEDRTGLFWLISNMGHDNEHYGNIVTYMRMMNMVPPSSQQAGM